MKIISNKRYKKLIGEYKYGTAEKEYYKADKDLINKLKEANKLIRETRLSLDKFINGTDTSSIYEIRNEIEYYLSELYNSKILYVFKDYIDEDR